MRASETTGSARERGAVTGARRFVLTFLSVAVARGPSFPFFFVSEFFG